MLNVILYVHPQLYFTVLCLKADNIVLRNKIKTHFCALTCFDAHEQQLFLLKILSTL